MHVVMLTSIVCYEIMVGGRDRFETCLYDWQPIPVR